ncbi:hypothetical protein BpHYR1_012585 [Brachionus plicatilis]|uniref:Uncharacterized protein n=1 Tax=Brachionus plicatilis TaxID=10195 RepID=A0A3M7T223_BRAPC|nr:hypothetical protein BpHYR1_012585 [Brachionus plicatilis]
MTNNKKYDQGLDNKKTTLNKNFFSCCDGNEDIRSHDNAITEHNTLKNKVKRLQIEIKTSRLKFYILNEKQLNQDLGLHYTSKTDKAFAQANARFFLKEITIYNGSPSEISKHLLKVHNITQKKISDIQPTFENEIPILSQKPQYPLKTFSAMQV